MEYISTAVTDMSAVTKQRLGNYYTSLQARYGDPRVYQQQQDVMRQQDARILYTHAKTQEDSLRAAYDKQVDEVRQQHSTRRQKG